MVTEPLDRGETEGPLRRGLVDWGHLKKNRKMRVSKFACHPFVSLTILPRTLWLINSSRVLDFLDGGIASSSRVDGLGKGIGEFLRSRVVDIPEVFLQRGRI
jgi:hypothetical protein